MVVIPKTSKINKIRGWLLFYVFVSIFGLFKSLELYGEDFTLDIFLLLDAIGFLLVIYSLVLIFQLNQKAPKWNLIRLWYTAIVWVVSAVYLYSVEELFIEEFIILLFPTIIVLIWIAYWKKSKRVKMTFGNNG